MKISDMGIHTLSFFAKLSYATIQEVIAEMWEQGNTFEVYKGHHGRSRIVCNTKFSEAGITLYANQFKGAGTSGIIVRINPCVVLFKHFQPTELYIPTEKNLRKISNQVNNYLECFDYINDCIPAEFADPLLDVAGMSLSRIDPCANILCDSEEEMKQVKRLFTKAAIIPRYWRDSFPKDSKIVENPTEANKHSYRQSCGSNKNKKKSGKNRASITVYDKKYQLQQIGRCPTELMDKHMLRIEAELTRSAFLHMVKGTDKKDPLALIKAVYDQTPHILSKYMKRMFLVEGVFVTYNEAVECINSANLKADTKEKMLYLVRKTSDNDNLTNALDKTKNEFNLSDQGITRLFKKFDKLGINPITLPNSSKIEQIDLFSLFTDQ